MYHLLEEINYLLILYRVYLLPKQKKYLKRTLSVVSYFSL